MNRNYVLVIFFATCIACKKNIDVPYATNNMVFTTIDTITQLDQMKGDTAIWNDNGVYRMVTHDDDEFEEETLLEKATCSKLFSGSARASAKKTLSKADFRSYRSFRTFQATLPTDATMRNLGITNSSLRVTEEDKNVTVTTVNLYAIKYESDGDLHIIMGDENSTYLFNCEASGYPSTSAAAYNTIKEVRTTITDRFNTDFCGRSSYTKFSPAVTVASIKGSLFFDIDHRAGTIGPQGLRPNTSWEIHPISAIRF